MFVFFIIKDYKEILRGLSSEISPLTIDSALSIYRILQPLHPIPCVILYIIYSRKETITTKHTMTDPADKVQCRINPNLGREMNTCFNDPTLWVGGEGGGLLDWLPGLDR